MASLDIDSLFTNIPLNDTIDICIEVLYNDNKNNPKIPRDVFRNLLNVWPHKESFFMFNNKFYK